MLNVEGIKNETWSCFEELNKNVLFSLECSVKEASVKGLFQTLHTLDNICLKHESEYSNKSSFEVEYDKFMQYFSALSDYLVSKGFALHNVLPNLNSNGHLVMHISWGKE